MPQSMTTVTFGSGTTAGGIGRVSNARVNGQNAIVTVVADEGGDLASLLADPVANAKLFEGDAIVFNGSNPVTIKAGTSAYTLGNGDYYPPQSSGYENNIPNLAVFIKDFVALGYDAQSGGLAVVAPPYTTAMGPPTGAHTYEGLAYAIRMGAVPTGGGFTMAVNFANESSEITSFSANLSTHGMITASGLNIDTTTGAFMGTAAFAAGTQSTSIINAADSAGTIYGQLHGEGGPGVTGGFHNSATTQADRVYGAFAGTSTR